MSTLADTRPTPATDLLHIERWNDPLATGVFDSDTDEALMFLAPVLGPTSTMVLHRLARALVSGGPVCWSLTDLATTFGVSLGQIDRTIDRLERFGYARRDGFTLAVRVAVPPLTRRHIERLPAHLAAAYTQMETQR